MVSSSASPHALVMRLHDAPFGRIARGEKTVEVRLNDEKRRGLKVGDVVMFVSRKTDETLMKKIVGLSVFDSFKELFDVIGMGPFGREESYAKQALDDMYLYYTLEDEKRWGVLAIELGEIT